MHERTAEWRTTTARDGSGYDILDRLSGGVCLGVIAASPWLFGTTEDWSVWCMNLLGYACGLLLLVKWFVRWRTGAVAVEGIWQSRDPQLRAGSWMVRSMGVLTGAVLFHCFLSALNSRATFYPGEQRFEYHERYVPWLPFNYDSALSWQAFWNYLALACFFWALRDWLLHPPRRKAVEEEVVLGLPPRFRTLFWVLAVNTALIAG